MANIRPPTRTPGSLKLLYTMDGIEHRCSVNLLANIDINDIPARRIDAQRLANLTGPVLVTQAVIHDWALYSRPATGVPATQLYIEPFTTPITGSAPGSAGHDVYASFTGTLVGRGRPGGPGYAIGGMRYVLFIGNSLVPVKKTKRFALSVSVAWQNLTAALGIDTSFWADFYGQKGTVQAYIDHQFNAHSQRTIGV